MPVEERALRSSERCSVHPASASIARCASCGRALCLTCAVPVRGEAYGTECLPRVLGPEVAAEAPPTPPPDRGMRRLVGAGFGVALLGTTLPWSRFGVGSARFGAWGQDLRWSLVVAGACVLGLAWWIVARRLGGSSLLDQVAIGLAALVVLGSALAIWRPPPFTRTWLGPWVSGAGGLVAVGGAVEALRRVRRHPAQEAARA